MSINGAIIEITSKEGHIKDVILSFNVQIRLKLRLLENSIREELNNSLSLLNLKLLSYPLK